MLPTLTEFSGTADDARAATEKLRLAADTCNLITPAPSCGQLIEGTEIVFSAILVNIARDTYTPGRRDDDGRKGEGLRALGRTALDQIAGAAGVSWDPRESRRIDDGSDARYCVYKATGSYRAFDGSPRTITNEKEIDLRDGGADLLDIVLDAENNGSNPERRIARARRDIQASCITKARNRALRDMGIRSSYTPEELARPFVIARLNITGRTNDPELRRTFAIMNAQRLMGGTPLYLPTDTRPRAKYIVRAEASPSLPAATTPAPSEPPAVVQPEPTPEPTPEPRRSPPRLDAPSAPRPSTSTSGSAPALRSAPEPTGAEFVAFGRAKGVPLLEVTDEDLDWYERALAKMVADPERAKYRSKNQRQLDEARAEIARRAPPDEEGGDDDDDFPY
jgi:hypothetical protein